MFEEPTAAEPEAAAAAEDQALDLVTRTHLVTRVSEGGAPLAIFFNRLGRSLAWNPANADAEPGSPQEVPAVVADAIEADGSLAPHFRCEPIASAGEAPAGGRRRRRSEPAA